MTKAELEVVFGLISGPRTRPHMQSLNVGAGQINIRLFSNLKKVQANYPVVMRNVKTSSMEILVTWCTHSGLGFSL